MTLKKTKLDFFVSLLSGWLLGVLTMTIIALLAGEGDENVERALVACGDSNESAIYLHRYMAGEKSLMTDCYCLHQHVRGIMECSDRCPCLI